MVGGRRPAATDPALSTKWELEILRRGHCCEKVETRYSWNVRASRLKMRQKSYYIFNLLLAVEAEMLVNSRNYLLDVFNDL